MSSPESSESRAPNTKKTDNVHLEKLLSDINSQIRASISNSEDSNYLIDGEEPLTMIRDGHVWIQMDDSGENAEVPIDVLHQYLYVDGDYKYFRCVSVNEIISHPRTAEMPDDEQTEE